MTPDYKSKMTAFIQQQKKIASTPPPQADKPITLPAKKETPVQVPPNMWPRGDGALPKSPSLGSRLNSAASRLLGNKS